VEPPRQTQTWVALTEEPLPLGLVADWAVRPDCGGLVVFGGTVRDHAEGRPGVTALTYEAYAEEVEPRLTEIARTARERWTDLGRLALLHRIGRLEVGECSVLVVASAPHRAEAFQAARYCIDALKASVPIWKRETWADGEDWGLDAHAVEPVDPA